MVNKVASDLEVKNTFISRAVYCSDPMHPTGSSVRRELESSPVRPARVFRLRLASGPSPCHVRTAPETATDLRPEKPHRLRGGGVGRGPAVEDKRFDRPPTSEVRPSTEVLKRTRSPQTLQTALGPPYEGPTPP